MLAIDERPGVVRLTDLEDLQVSVGAVRGWLEAEHQVEVQRARARGPLRHPHPPVLRDDLVTSAAAALVIERQKGDAVLHELPAGWRHVHVLVVGWRRVLREPGSGH